MTLQDYCDEVKSTMTLQNYCNKVKSTMSYNDTTRSLEILNIN